MHESLDEPHPGHETEECNCRCADVTTAAGEQTVEQRRTGINLAQLIDING